MALIATQSPETATGEVADVYGQVKARFGVVPTPIQLLSASPIWLRHAQEGMSYYMSHPHIGFAALAAIRMLVSIESKCAYCIDRNASVLINMCDWTADQVAATKASVDGSPLDAKERALVKLAVQAAHDSLSVTAADIDALRALGWTDSDIMDGVNHAARMVALDILFNTFKVERDF
jgi:alkylhydroperoxidase family enzyme